MKKNRSLLLYVTGIVIAIILFLVTKEFLASGVNVAISLFAMIITIVLDIRFSQEEIKDAFAFDKTLYKERWLVTMLKPIIDDYTEIVRKHQKSPSKPTTIPYDLARKSIEESVTELGDLRLGRWVIPDKAERMQILIDVVKTTKQSIIATCDVDFNTWWKSHHGEKYLSANLDASQNRGVRVERIFIVNECIAYTQRGCTEASQELLGIIKKHENAGAIILIAIQETLEKNLQPDEFDNMLVCDKSFVAWSLIKASNGGYASFYDGDIDKAISRFERIKFYAKPPAEYPFYTT